MTTWEKSLTETRITEDDSREKKTTHNKRYIGLESPGLLGWVVRFCSNIISEGENTGVGPTHTQKRRWKV